MFLTVRAFLLVLIWCGGFGAEEIPCGNCAATGLVACTVNFCDKGKALCPGKCLKKEVGKWEIIKFAGHPDGALCQKFYGKGTWRAWTMDHLGEVIEIQNGSPVNVGKCPKCQGSTRVACPTCDGKGEVKCKVCAGSGKTTQEALDRYKAELNKLKHPDTVLLKDGKILQCKIVAKTPTKLFYDLDGKSLDIDLALVKELNGKALVPAPAP